MRMIHVAIVLGTGCGFEGPPVAPGACSDGAGRDDDPCPWGCGTDGTSRCGQLVPSVGPVLPDDVVGRSIRQRC